MRSWQTSSSTERQRSQIRTSSSTAASADRSGSITLRRSPGATSRRTAPARIGIELYQIEVYSFLCGRLRSEADAHDLFGQLAEDAMRGIERFEWRASFRTWLY